MAASASDAAASTSTDEVCFGPYKIRANEQVFYESKLSCALVNLKPIVPGMYSFLDWNALKGTRRSFVLWCIGQLTRLIRDKASKCFSWIWLAVLY